MLNCTFVDCREPLDGDNMSAGNVDLHAANTVTYTTRLSRLTAYRLPYNAVRVGYALGLLYAVLCTVVVMLRNFQVLPSPSLVCFALLLPVCCLQTPRGGGGVAVRIFSLFFHIFGAGLLV